MSLPDLRLDWCSTQAARFAVMHWHYSEKMTAGKNAYIGVWESGRFIGALIFGNGGGMATDGRRWGLARIFEVAELRRVALTDHVTPVSRIVAIAVRMIVREYPRLKLLISYADPRAGHHGGIYQAGGWVYVGTSSKDHAWLDKTGKLHHSRTVGHGVRVHFGKANRESVRKEDCVRVELPPKHCYLLPLDDATRALIAPLAKPYPKRTKDQAPTFPVGLGGETPTRPLQPSQSVSQ